MMNLEKTIYRPSMSISRDNSFSYQWFQIKGLHITIDAFACKMYALLRLCPKYVWHQRFLIKIVFSFYWLLGPTSVHSKVYYTRIRLIQDFAMIAEAIALWVIYFSLFIKFHFTAISIIVLSNFFSKCINLLFLQNDYKIC